MMTAQGPLFPAESVCSFYRRIAVSKAESMQLLTDSVSRQMRHSIPAVRQDREAGAAIRPVVFRRYRRLPVTREPFFRKRKDKQASAALRSIPARCRRYAAE